ncbi:serine/threonine-protein kinase pkn1 [Nitritalea halalkaliphila LW7]|uniref:Serine/threonine-protein kinase pkn1 n=1 Tax=Nitritalea halalkaliphila LW7 TaxID=1189621 RepID=I5C9N3_9BACT|nr:SUMF1/EgtB/PvdO family nonheme iron enzyme [Nitritalea halalkaliphila]EIM78535.1 serine/threonine-protein kinase pkn1 [Nitritalea halalkaliphila LW7]
MDQYEVTNAEFYAFVEATGYVTVAERIGGIMATVPGKGWQVLKDHTWRTHRYYAKRGIPLDMGTEPKLQNRPVLALAPEDVLAYAQWVGKRIPTYAEWVHAARAGQEDYAFLYPGGNKIRQVAWYEKNSDNYFPEPVGTKAPNELGIYDLAGNVCELVYSVRNPGEFVLIGGSYIDDQETCEIGRITNNVQLNWPLDWPSGILGIRLVKDL